MIATKRRIYQIIEKSEKGDTASAVFDWFLIVLICLNFAEIIINSFNTTYDWYNKLSVYFEYFSIIVFSIEYALRLWTAPLKISELGISSRIPHLRYFVSFMALVDLCAILPFYLPFVIHVDLRFLRILRLFRLLRILKLNRYNNSLDLIGRVIKNEKEKLIMTIFIAVIMLLLASSVMYYIENAVQPDNFPNIPATLWWAVATLTTVGYGDVYPVTVLGKLLSGLIALMGIGLVALPSGIISSGLIKEVRKEKKEKEEKKYCPHCGAKL